MVFRKFVCICVVFLFPVCVFAEEGEPEKKNWDASVGISYVTTSGNTEEMSYPSYLKGIQKIINLKEVSKK